MLHGVNRCWCAWLLCAAMGFSVSAFAGAGKPACCQSGVRYVCCPKYETKAVEKTGFEVECEPICVPRVRLPWQDCRTPRCARVICVHRLKKETIECGTKCVLTWEPRAVCTRCGKPCSTCCPSARCAPCLPE